MREILTDKLWLGNAADTRNIEGILQAGIRAVVDVAAEQLTPTLPRSLICCHFPIVDGQQNSQAVLRVAVETLVLLLDSEIPTLVCCGAGMSRSLAVVAAALSISRGGTPNDRLHEIALGHPHDVSPQLWRDICCICAEVEQRRNP